MPGVMGPSDLRVRRGGCMAADPMAADPMAADPDSPRVAGISRRTMARGLALDVGLPVVTYYVLHAAGVSNWFALLGATLVAGARIALVAIRQRMLNALAFVMLVIYG